MMRKNINSMPTVHRRELKKKNKERSRMLGARMSTDTYGNNVSFVEDQMDHSDSLWSIGSEYKNEMEELNSRSRKWKIADENNLLQAEVARRQGTTKGDAVAKSWAMQYDQLEGTQQVIANRIISDVLFHASFGSLQKGHVTQVHRMFNEEQPSVPIYKQQTQCIAPGPYTEPFFHSSFPRINEQQALRSNSTIINSRGATPHTMTTADRQVEYNVGKSASKEPWDGKPRFSPFEE